MKHALLAALLLISAIVVPLSAPAGVDVSIGISLPPPVVLAAPPDVIVIPDTDSVYVVPDVDVDLYFWNGWWWRPWNGRWYRSPYYNRGWVYYTDVPGFYFDVDPNWRRHYRERSWYGHRWDYERIPNRSLEKNWRGWHNTRYWEGKRSWGVRSYQPRTQREMQDLRRQRQEHYHQQPDVRRHQQWKQEQHKSRGKQLREQQGHPAGKERTMRPQNGPGGRNDKQQSQHPKKREFDDGPEHNKERW